MTAKPAPITTPEIIEAAYDQSGIPKEQLMLIVARSALIRHLATHPDYSSRFVLKGGTLLYHVYGTRRVSVRDTDFAHPGQGPLLPDDLERILTVDLRPAFYLPVTEGRWNPQGSGREMFEIANVPFEIDGLTGRPRRRGRGGMKITVSVRQAEWMDPQPPQLYEDNLLAHDPRFRVHALTRDELAAEKVIGWSLRGQPKHYVDLGLLARDHAAALDTEKVAAMVRGKVAIERAAESTRDHYRAAKIATARDLARRFRAPAVMGQLNKANYDEQLNNTIVFLDEEPEFEDIGKVKERVETFWGPVIDELAT